MFRNICIRVLGIQFSFFRVSFFYLLWINLNLAHFHLPFSMMPFYVDSFSIHYLYFHLPNAFANLTCALPGFLGIIDSVLKDSNSNHWHLYPWTSYGTVPAAPLKISLWSNANLIFSICVLCSNSPSPNPQLSPLNMQMFPT